ncbi:MAG: biotin--[acetyl-CoA-carboxylase] ligase [Desulfobacterales bacterium]|nr:biotin--[acetyl-CoA-carboxylase] ligase [Desulfobacterales bacterium]
MTAAAHQSKGQILQLLRGEEPVVSGERISKEMGLSRVAVWKHIRKLGEFGYEIEATAKGYRLLRSPDTPYPWEFPGREGLIHHFPEVESTMEIARQMARDDCPAMTTVVADRQRRGRGRLQRSWASDPGGLYFTVVTRPGVDPQQSGRVNLAASVALAAVVCDTFGVKARVKWPNDILVDERKLAGLLSQMDAEADRTAFVNIGIGINVNNDPTRSAPNAVSMRRLLRREVSRKEVLAVFLDRLEVMLAAGLGPELIEQWRAVNATLGRAVKVETAWQRVEGTAVDVDENGALIVETHNGKRQTVFYGDCFHVGKGAGPFLMNL